MSLPDVEADMGDLRVGVGAPGNRPGRSGAGGRDTARSGPTMRAAASAGVGVLVLQADVAGGVDARIARPQEVVDPDAAHGIVTPPPRLPDPCRRRSAAGRRRRGSGRRRSCSGSRH